MAVASQAALPIASATVHVLSGLDGYSPTGLNDSDVVVGAKFDPVAFTKQAFKWDAKHGVRILPSPHPFDEGAFAVNNIGNVVGFTGAHAIVWEPSGTYRILLAPGPDTGEAAYSCSADAINKNSNIVGSCTVHAAFTYAAIFYWHTVAQVNQNVDFPWTAISNDGYIGGGNILISPTGEQIVLHSHDPGGSPSVLALTYHGWGAGYDLEGTTCAASYVVGEATAWLSAPNQRLPEFLLGTCGQATGITDDWHISGTGTDAHGDVSSDWAFVWFPGPRLQRLPGLGTAGETSTAVAINAHHHILGTITSKGVTHVVMWQLAH